MRSALALMALAVSTGHLWAQTVIDGSDAGISESHLKEMNRVFADQTFDPLAIQLRNLRMWRAHGTDYDVVCGEFNGKNKLGGYVGFQPFQFFPPYSSLAFNSVSCP